MRTPRIRRLSARCPLLAVLAVGCGSEPPINAPVLAKTTPPMVAPVAPPSLGPGMRGPSPELSALSRPSPSDTLALYVDLEAFASSPLGRTLIPEVLAVTGAQLPKLQPCLSRVMANARELAVGGDGTPDHESLITVRFKAGTAHDTLATCAAAWDTVPNPSPTPIPGTDEHLSDAIGVFARRGDVIVDGDRTAIERLLAAAPAPWPTELALGPDALLALTGSGEGITSHVGLAANASRLLVTADATFPDEGTAHGVSTKAAKLLTLDDMPPLGNDPATAIVTRLAQSVHLEQHGKTLAARLELVEASADQARDLGALATLSVFAVRRYIRSSKEAEARNALGAIGRSYVAAFAATPATAKARTKKKLHAFPPVPAEVPQTGKYQSSRADWAPWSELHFEMDAPQLFQYEIVAAKNGQSADVIARRDLDGTGKVTELKVHLYIDPRTHVLEAGPVTTSDE